MRLKENKPIPSEMFLSNERELDEMEHYSQGNLQTSYTKSITLMEVEPISRRQTQTNWYLSMINGTSGKESTCQCRRYRILGFNPQVEKIPWSRKWQPAPVFLPGRFHGQRNLAGYSPQGHKESDMTEYTHAGMINTNLFIIRTIFSQVCVTPNLVIAETWEMHSS